MKRFTSLLLSLVLLLSFAGVASAAKMVQPFANAYYQIYIPGDWIIDTSRAAEYWGVVDFGYMYASDESMLIEARLYVYSDWAHDSLWNGNDDDWNDYVDFLMDDLKEENPEFIAKFFAGQYPGALVKATNDYGTYLYGEVMINAYSYGFYFYQYNEDGTINSDISDDNVELFKNILETFTFLN